MECSEVRLLANSALQELAFDTAIFYANKLLTLEPKNPKNAYILAHAFFHTQQYKRAIHLLSSFLPKPVIGGGIELPRSVEPIQVSNIVSYLECLHLTGKAYLKTDQWQDCLELLQNFDTAMKEARILVADLVNKAYGASGASSSVRITALLCLLRAQALESIDIRVSAIEWYKKALEDDVRCVEAWNRLTEGFMLLPAEEAALFDSLKFTPNLEWLRGVYLSKTSTYIASLNQTSSSASKSRVSRAPQVSSAAASEGANPASMDEPQTPERHTSSDRPQTSLVEQIEDKYHLSTNEDLIASKAQALFYSNRTRQAFELTSSVLERDPYSTSVLPTHLSCLVELGKKSELYLLAHKLAESAPKSAISWYAVGCYYYLIRSWQNARLYFGKSTAMKRDFGAAWLAYGNTFAHSGEHDQALSAYRTAARMLVGSHLPTLFIATELARAKDLELAKVFAQKALALQPRDPFPHHEVGVIHYRLHDWPKAIHCFLHVIELVGKENMDETWEPTVFNLGQAYLRANQPDNALPYFEWSLLLIPRNTTTYSALATTHHMLGNLSAAIDYYHQVLSVSPEDAFATACLEDALQEWVLLRTHNQAQEIASDGEILEGLEPMDTSMGE